MSTAHEKLSEPSSSLYSQLDHAMSNEVTIASKRFVVPAITSCAIAVPSAIALAISTYLAYAAFTMSEVAGCGGGGVFDCGHVLHSKWSKAFGIPVSVFAFATHLLLIGGLFVTQLGRFSNEVRAAAAGVVCLTAFSAAAAALYFISLQVFVLEHLCSYCMSAHACGLIVAGLAAWKLPVSLRWKGRLAGIAVAGISALAVIQASSAEPPKYIIEQLTPSTNVPAEKGDAPGEPADSESFDLFSAPTDDDPARIFSAPVDDAASFNPQRRFQSDFGARLSSTAVSLTFLTQWRTALAGTMLVLAEPHPQSSSKPSTPTNAGSANEATVAEEKSDRLVPIINGSIKLKAVDWPLVGSPNAKHIFVEMFDYTCAHCRNTHAAVKSAKDLLGDAMAIVTLPVPMNRNCNGTINTSSPIHAESCELSKLAIAVWRVEPKQFAAFHDWMFQGDTAPTYAAALNKAQKITGTERLTAELGKTVCDQYVKRNVELYKRVGGGPIPKMIFKQTAIVGEFTSGESLAKLIRQYTAEQ